MSQVSVNLPSIARSTPEQGKMKADMLLYRPDLFKKQEVYSYPLGREHTSCPSLGYMRVASF